MLQLSRVLCTLCVFIFSTGTLADGETDAIRKRALQLFPESSQKTERENYERRALTILNNIPESSPYSQISRLFLLVDPLFVTEDVHLKNANSPQLRFNELDYTQTPTPTWQNFLEGFERFAMPDPSASNSGLTPDFFFDLHKTLLKGNGDGTLQSQLDSGEIRNWDRQNLYTSTIDRDHWNAMSREARSELSRFFNVTETPQGATIKFKLPGELKQSLPEISFTPGQRISTDDLVKFIVSSVTRRTDPIARATEILYLYPRIHPYENGNGRTARQWAAAELLAAGLPMPVGLPTDDFMLSKEELNLHVQKSLILGKMWQVLLSQAQEKGIPPDQFFQSVYRGSNLEGLVLYTPSNTAELQRFVDYLKTLPTDPTKQNPAQAQWAQKLLQKTQLGLAVLQQRQASGGTPGEVLRSDFLKNVSASTCAEMPMPKTLRLFHWGKSELNEPILRLGGFPTGGEGNFGYSQDLYRGSAAAQPTESNLGMVRHLYDTGGRGDAAGPGIYFSSDPFDSMRFGPDLLIAEVTGPVVDSLREGNPKIAANEALDSGNWDSLAPISRYTSSWHVMTRADPTGRTQVRIRPPTEEDAEAIFNQKVGNEPDIGSSLSFLVTLAKQLQTINQQKTNSARNLFKRILFDPQYGYGYLEKNQDAILSLPTNRGSEPVPNLLSILGAYQRELPNDPRTQKIAGLWFGAHIRSGASLSEKTVPYLVHLTPDLLQQALSHIMTEPDALRCLESLKGILFHLKGVLEAQGKTVADHPAIKAIHQRVLEQIKSDQPEVKRAALDLYLDVASQNPDRHLTELPEVLRSVEHMVHDTNSAWSRQPQAYTQYEKLYALGSGKLPATVPSPEAVKDQLVESFISSANELPLDRILVFRGMVKHPKLDSLALSRTLEAVKNKNSSFLERQKALQDYQSVYENCGKPSSFPTPESITQGLITDWMRDLAREENRFDRLTRSDSIELNHPTVNRFRLVASLKLARQKDASLTIRSRVLPRYQKALEGMGPNPPASFPSIEDLRAEVASSHLGAIQNIGSIDRHKRLSDLIAQGLGNTMPALKAAVDFIQDPNSEVSHKIDMLLWYQTIPHQYKLPTADALSQEWIPKCLADIGKIAESKQRLEALIRLKDRAPDAVQYAKLLAQAILDYSGSSHELIHQAVVAIKHLATDKDPKVYESLLSLSHRGNPSVLSLIRNAFDMEYGYLVQAESLASSTHPAARQLVAKLLRISAHASNHKLEPLVMGLLKDPTPEVQLEAARNCLAYGRNLSESLSHEVTRVLADTTQDKALPIDERLTAVDQYVTAFNRLPLEKRSPFKPPTEIREQLREEALSTALETARTASDPYARLQALRIVVRLDPDRPEILEWMLKALKDAGEIREGKDERSRIDLRKMAMDYLTTKGRNHPGVQALFNGMMLNEVPEIRKALAQFFGRKLPNDLDTVHALTQSIMGIHGDRMSRESLEALANIGIVTPELVETLIAAARQKDQDLEAVLETGNKLKIGDPRWIRILADVVMDPDLRHNNMGAITQAANALTERYPFRGRRAVKRTANSMHADEGLHSPSLRYLQDKGNRAVAARAEKAQYRSTCKEHFEELLEIVNPRNILSAFNPRYMSGWERAGWAAGGTAVVSALSFMGYMTYEMATYEYPSYDPEPDEEESDYNRASYYDSHHDSYSGPREGYYEEACRKAGGVIRDGNCYCGDRIIHPWYDTCE